MFPKPKYTDPLEYLKNVVSLYMVIAFSPYVLFLLTNIVSEKVNPPLCHIFLQIHFILKCTQKANAYSKSTM